MALVNTLKTIADATFGNINKGGKYLLERMDIGNKNLFMMIMYPKGLDDMVFGSFGDVIDLVSDTLIVTLNMRSVDVNFLSIEYEAFGELKGAKKINYPDTITFTLLEDDYGKVKNYIYSWLNKIVFPVNETDAISGIARTNYVFTDNQEGAKKNALLISQGGTGFPAFRPIRFEGLKYQSMGNITYGHGDGEPLMFEITCSVDSVWFEPLF